ncbi:MAG: hypothetical protein HQL22_02810 [Candidatus Omnitrophica bacterium]|nr:hypothetical protein [Candidatus Omnitrophota bacterium]
MKHLFANAPDWLIEKLAHKQAQPSSDFDELLKRYGQPFYCPNGDEVSMLNQTFWAGLYALEHTGFFDYKEKTFYLYSPDTGLYVEISINTIKQQIAVRILEASRELNLPSLEKKRSNHLLDSILAQLKGVMERPNTVAKNHPFIHVANGVIIFNPDGTTDFTSFSPIYFSKNRSPLVYKPGAKCPRFLKELLNSAVSPENALLIQKVVGCFLLGNNPIQRILILDGLPERGKSQLVLVIQKIIGIENVTELRTKHLSERFELFRYRRKKLLVGVDVPGRFLSEKGAYVLKGLVGGDLFDAEQKGGTGSFQIQGNFGIVIVSNSRLQVHLDGDVGAWRRRLLIVRFEAPPPTRKIPNFADVLIQEEGPGILNWALEGAQLLLNDIATYGDIRLNETQRNIVDALLSESDSLRNFLSKCVIKAVDNDLPIYEIVEAYAQFCPQQGWNPKPITIIHRELPQLMLELFAVSKSHSVSRNGKDVNGFRGVKLVNPGAMPWH